MAAACLMTVPAYGHHMGRAFPICYADSGLPQAEFTAQVVVSYFEEQMGREMELSAESSIEKCLSSIVDKKVPMAVIPVFPVNRIPQGVIVVTPVIDTGKETFFLVMGRTAKTDLQFSLVPRYLELLSSKLTNDMWEKGLVRVSSGEGVRKVALEMLREADLI